MTLPIELVSVSAPHILRTSVASRMQQSTGSEGHCPAAEQEQSDDCCKSHPGSEFIASSEEVRTCCGALKWPLQQATWPKMERDRVEDDVDITVNEGCIERERDILLGPQPFYFLNGLNSSPKPLSTVLSFEVVGGGGVVVIIVLRTEVVV
mmetsp:Transcript_45512/g.114644  ORF Transcript_45512/g.114644 Transcript_45512/m.114644 type:complete len:151 (+) Transcript_45512:19-471(+)